MKVKLLMLLGMTAVPLLSVGQSAVFYNKGKMSIISTSTANTVLYVNGDFVVGRDATDPDIKSAIFVKSSKTVITGDFIQNASYVVGNGGTAFVDHPTADSDKGVFVFRGIGPQAIKTTLTPFNTLRKGANYVNFPNVEVDNNNHITVSPELAVSVQNLNLKKGKLILDSRRMANTDVVNGGGTSEHKEGTSTLQAHMFVPSGAASKIMYNRRLAGVTNLNDLGVVQVKLAVDDITGSDPTGNRSLIGMGSPFKQIRADYFMWNFLMFPYDNNIIGQNNYTITDPRTIIKAGKGFVVGVDLKGTDSDYYTGSVAGDHGTTVFDSRNTESFTFDRLAFNNKNNIFSLKGFPLGNKDPGTNYGEYDIDKDPYAKEELTFNDIVDYPLINGFNFLSNPFTTPLSLKRLLDEGGAAAANPWGVSPNSSVNATGAARDIMNRVWILNPSSTGSGLLNNDRIHVMYSYLLMKNVGGTYTSEYDDGANDGYTIAPMQMFVVYAPELGARKKITIPASERVISAGSNFLRSTTSTPADDYLFEVNDLTTKAYDRVAIVLRTPEEILTNGSYTNVKKVISNVFSDSNTKSALRTVTEEGVVTQAANSILYTKDAEGNALESYFLPAAEGAQTVSTPLYLTPSLTAQKVAINAKRLNTMATVNEIWLDDSLTKKSVELSLGKEYVASIKPTDKADRFTVRFVRSSSGVPGEDDNESASKSISSYYSNGELVVQGFEDSDLNSLISVYDIQGRMITQAKVNELTVRIRESFAPGAYIVKVIGNKSYVSKFLVR